MNAALPDNGLAFRVQRCRRYIGRSEGKALVFLLLAIGVIALLVWLVHPDGPVFKGRSSPAALGGANVSATLGPVGIPLSVALTEQLSPSGEYAVHVECDVTPPPNRSTVTVDFVVTQATQHWSRSVSQTVPAGAAKVRIAADFPEPELIAGFPKAEARLLP